MKREATLQIEKSDDVTKTIPPARAAAQVEALAVARIVAGCSAGGVLVTEAIIGVVGLLLLLAGKHDAIRAFATALPMTAAFTACGWAAMRWIDRRITSLIQRVRLPEMCLPLLEMEATGLPLGRIRQQIEDGLCASLRTVDVEWWDKNSRLMKLHAGMALDAARKPGKFRSLESLWIPELLEAIERCGRTEMLRKVEQLQRGSVRRPVPPMLADQAKKCAESLHAKIRYDDEIATLLRSSASSDNVLLRAAIGCESVDTDLLLRPSQPGELTQTPSVNRTSAPTEETLQLNIK
jgi:hypothetical protein